MTKHRWKEAIQELYENHINPEKDEELEQSKQEVQTTLSHIPKQPKDRGKKKKNREVSPAELHETIEELKKQYNIVLDLYTGLKDEFTQTYNDLREEEGFYTATSSSDSDSDSNQTHINKHRADAEETQRMIDRMEDESRQLKKRLEEKDQKILSMVETTEILERELGADITHFKLEKRKLHEEIDRKSKLIKKLQGDNSRLNSQVQRLETEMKAKDGELFNLRPVVETLELDLIKIRSQNAMMVEEVSIKADENENLSLEVGVLQGRVARLEKELTEKDNQLSSMQNDIGGGGRPQDDHESASSIVGLTSQINQLKEEKDFLQETIYILEKKLEDRGDEFSNQINVMTREVSHLHQEMEVKQVMDEKMRAMEENIQRLVEEKDNLQGKILELEIRLTEREDKMVELQRKLNDKENDTTSTIAILTTQVNDLHQELSEERQMSAERINQVESENAELSRRICDQEVILKQQEDNNNRIRKDCRMVKNRFQKTADRKMEEMAEEFRKNLDDKLRILSQRIKVAEQLHTENLEGLQRMKELYDQGEEPTSEILLEKTKRMMSKRVVPDITTNYVLDMTKVSDVANKMLEDMDKTLWDCFGKKEDEFIKRISKVSNELKSAKNWIRFMMDEIKPCLKNGSGGTPSSPLAAGRSTSPFTRQYSSPFSQPSSPFARGTPSSPRSSPFCEQPSSPFARSFSFFSSAENNRDDQDKGLREKLTKLEEKVSNEKGDKVRLMRGMYELHRKVAELEKAVAEKEEGKCELQKKKDELEKVVAEKEEWIVKLGEEKVEAIKQLCLWIDYHHNRWIQLMNMLNSTKKSRIPGRD